MQEKKSFIIITIIISLIVGAFSGMMGSFFLKPYLESTGWGRSFLQTSLTEVAADVDSTKTLKIKEESAAVEVVEKVTPGVVSIVATKELENIYNLTGPYFFGFDGVYEQNQENGKFKQTIGRGTGFVIDEKGLILTNRHVVEDEQAEYTVILNNGEQYAAQVLGRDMIKDIAILQIEAENLSAVELGDSGSIKIGQTVIAIGNALGEYSNTVTRGVVSGINRKVVTGGVFANEEVIDGAIQTDAAINVGNSGGPLLNLAGQVIGINTAVNWEGSALGFAIPIDQAKNVIESVQQYGRIVRPWLGVRYVQLNEQIAEKNSIKYNYGALVIRGAGQNEVAIVPDSPAAEAGLLENDIILEINGQIISEEQTLLDQIAKFMPGDEIELKIARNETIVTVKVTLAEREE